MVAVERGEGRREKRVTELLARQAMTAAGTPPPSLRLIHPDCDVLACLRGKTSEQRCPLLHLRSIPRLPLLVTSSHLTLTPHPWRVSLWRPDGARPGTDAVDFRRQMGEFAGSWASRPAACRAGPVALSHVWESGDVICVWTRVSERAAAWRRGAVCGRGRLSCCYKIITRGTAAVCTLLSGFM